MHKHRFSKSHLQQMLFHKYCTFHVVGQLPNVGRWFALWLVICEVPYQCNPGKDTACQPGVVRAMLKEKEGLPFVINSVFFIMLKKDGTCLGWTDQLLVCFRVACSEAYERLELDIHPD